MHIVRDNANFTVRSFIFLQIYYSRTMEIIPRVRCFTELVLPRKSIICHYTPSQNTYCRRQGVYASEGVLTIARGVASGGGEARGARHALSHTVAHVAARGGHQVVGHPARAVPNLTWNNDRLAYLKSGDFLLRPIIITATVYSI
jgi:hypothetical protein